MPTPRADGPDIHDKYQPVTDWAWMQNYKLGSCKLSEGRTVRPGGIVYFKKFREGALLYPGSMRYRGLYHWLLPTSSMRAQADAFLTAVDRSLGGLKQGEFVQADWETTPNVALVTSDQCYEWCQYIEDEYPGRVIVYSSDWLPDSTLDDDSRREFDEWQAAHPDYPLWFANYSYSGTGPSSGWTEIEKYDADVWQWTSSFYVPGIANRCDMNMIRKSGTLERICGYSAVEQPEEKPEEKPETPIVVAPVVGRFTATPGRNTAMDILIEYGEAKDGLETASWYHALKWGAFGLEWLEKSESANTLKQAGAPRVSVDRVNGTGDAYVLALIEDNGTYGPSPYGPGGSVPNPALHEAWVRKSRGGL